MGFSSLAQQDIMNDTLVWNVVEVKQRATNESFSKSDLVTVYGSNKIVWEQTEVGRSYSFTIEDINGEWEDLDEDGQIDYDVRIDDSTGVITFKRSDQALSIAFDLKRGEKITYPFLLIVASIQSN